MLRRLLIAALLVLLPVLAWNRAHQPQTGTAASESFAAAAPLPQDNRPEPGFRTEVHLEAGGFEVRWACPKVAVTEAILYRSTSDLSLTKLDNVRFPIVTISLPASREGRFVDEAFPAGVPLHYQVRLKDAEGRFHYGPAVAVEAPSAALPSLQSPSLLVDKTQYCLEVRDGGRTVRRYPIALGRNPFRRKLHEDNASTPEGHYRIVSLQPQATYHRAYDLDYPSEVDRQRYEQAARKGELPPSRPGIGGEIQIHGKGIHANWTFGCIALRNQDMDELFAHPEIAVGCPVDIAGREFNRADL